MNSNQKDFLVHTMLQDRWGNLFLPGDYVILLTKLKEQTYQGKIEDIDPYSIQLQYKDKRIFINISNLKMINHYKTGGTHERKSTN